MRCVSPEYGFATLIHAFFPGFLLQRATPKFTIVPNRRSRNFLLDPKSM